MGVAIFLVLISPLLSYKPKFVKIVIIHVNIVKQTEKKPAQHVEIRLNSTTGTYPIIFAIYNVLMDTIMIIQVLLKSVLGVILTALHVSIMEKISVLYIKFL